MTSDVRRYLIVSPCRDEGRFARQTLDSVLAQSVPPALWVIVDDGSTDETPAILAAYAVKHPCIRVVRRQDRGGRSVGPGVIDAFYAGLDAVDLDEFDYVCKLDLDLVLPPTYFETLVRRMQGNPRLGNCSGKPYYVGPDGQLVSEGCGDENAIGASKFYRRECFQEIGGFVRQVMWDGIDGHRCRMLGWIACSWDEPELRFVHLRPMGSSQKGILTGRTRHGFGQYFMGTGPIYMTASCLFRLTHPPLLAGAAATWWGYARSMLRRDARYDEPDFRRFLRAYQWDCLVRGKRRATDALNNKQAGVWAQRRSAATADSLAVANVRDLPVVRLAGQAIHAVSERQAIEYILARLAGGQGGWVITPNLDHLRRCRSDAAFAGYYCQASLVVADGMPLVWAARLQGTPLPQRVAGSSLIWTLSAAAAEQGRSIFLLGGDPGTAEAAGQILSAGSSSLRIAGTACPPVGFEKDAKQLAALRDQLAAARPDIVYVALGSPKQEQVIAALRDTLPQAWWLGVGISFSFVAGTVRRAPRWMQKAGLEWVHRLVQEPRRLARRYLVDGLPFAIVLLSGAILNRLHGTARVTAEAADRADEKSPTTEYTVSGKAGSGRGGAETPDAGT